MSYDYFLDQLNNREKKRNLLKLLVVEDNREIVENLKDSFINSYFDIKFVSSWLGLQKHLLTSESFLPDLILSDIDFSDDKHIASADYGKFSMGTTPVGLMLILPFVQNTHYCQLSIYSSKFFSITPESMLQKSELRSPWLILPLGIIAAAQNKPARPYSSSLLTMSEGISSYETENTVTLTNGSVEELILESYSDIVSPEHALDSCVKKYRQGLFKKSAEGEITFDKKQYGKILIQLRELLVTIQSNPKVELSVDMELKLVYREEDFYGREFVVCLWSLFGDKIKPVSHQLDVDMGNVINSIINELECVSLCNDVILDKVCDVIEYIMKDNDSSYWDYTSPIQKDLVEYIDDVLDGGITSDEHTKISRTIIMFENLRVHLIAQKLGVKKFNNHQYSKIAAKGERNTVKRLIKKVGGPFGYDKGVEEIYYDYTKHEISFEEYNRLTTLTKWYFAHNEIWCKGGGYTSKPLEFNLNDFIAVISQKTIKL